MTARRRAYVDALHETRRSYSERRDALDIDHLRLMLGFWLSADSDCVDIGANRGSVLQMIHERAPHGVHHAFEPIPHLARRLGDAFPSVVVHELALTDSPGTADFTVVDNAQYDGYSGIRESLRDLPETWETHSITVETARLDDVLPADYEPRFIKIDVEGAELRVLRGAREMLRRHRPVLFMEHGARIDGDTGEIHELLTGLGYAIHNADGGGPYDDLGSMIAGAKTRDGWLWNWVCL